ncbi:MAG: nitrilase-related carbon-nitrogen hydrolase, partial [Nitrospinota bacterium]
FVFFANRVGYEDGINFWGGSEVVGPDGEVVSSASLFKETLLVAQVDTAEVRRARIASPTLRDEELHLTLRELARLSRRAEP